MATKLHFTGVAGASITYQNKYSVETDSIIEVEDQDIDLLLATGSFEKVSSSKTSEDTTKDSKDSNQKTKG